jgi:phospholipid/cholesterol/gamma-HCH transport system ATP-binding protein
MEQATAQAPSVVSLEQVGMRFGTHEVLRDINLEIRRGETTVIVGESGCGKTVLLKIIIGLLAPTSGRARVHGRVLAELAEPERTRERLRFGFLFQGAALFDSLSVFDNVAFALREHTDKREEEVERLVRQRLHEVGLPRGAEAKKPAELSGGMKKRVGFARAMILNPEVMLYDEPTTGLDPIMSDVINELILQTRGRHRMTGIVVTHDLRTVQKVADRVVMLFPLSRLQAGESQIVFDGTLDEFQQSSDTRVTQFARGEARDRLMEFSQPSK